MTPANLRVTKIEAAIRQVEASISAFYEGRLDVAITLAAASEGMLPTSEKSIFQRLKSAPKALERMSQKEWNDRITAAIHWLKHTTDNKPDEVILTAAQAAFIIAGATSKVPSERWTPQMALFREWFLANAAKL